MQSDHREWKFGFEIESHKALSALVVNLHVIYIHILIIKFWILFSQTIDAPQGAQGFQEKLPGGGSPTI